jgi:hypothetical protein
MSTRRAVTALFLCSCVVAPSTRAEVVYVLVPGLTGNYPVNPLTTVRSAEVQLPRTPDVIHSVTLLITGTAVTGLADCGQAGVIDIWPMEFIAEMGDGWWATHELKFTNGNFEFAMLFEPIDDPVTWDFFLDGEAELALSGAPWTQLTVCDPLLFPSGVVTEVTLFVDGEFPLLVEPSTWGRVKALYR